MKTLYTAGLYFSVCLLLSACASAPPAATHDGLMLANKSPFDSLYLKPGVDLAAYSQIRLEPCTVAFKANWLRNQNAVPRGLSYRITEEDMEAIKGRIAESCDRHFTDALSDESRYSLVTDDRVEGPVLEIRPAIIDLDIRAPDVDAPGIHRTYTTSFGEMSLRLEMFDAASGEILSRVNDRQRDFESEYLQWTNRATNMADVNRFLRRWRDDLLEGLASAQAHSPLSE